MNRTYRFQFRPGIRTRLLVLSLGLALITMAFVAYLAVNSIQTSGESAMQIGEQTLRDQTEEFMLAQILDTVDRDNLLFEKIAQDAENLAEFAARVFDNPDAFSRESYWLAEEHMFIGPDGQYINGENDISTVFVPNFAKIDDAFTQELELSAYLDMIFPTVLENDPNLVAVYLITPRDISRLYPNINLGSIVPGNYSAVQDIFFQVGTPQNNPDRNVRWTPVYDDPAGQGLLVSVIAPVYTSRNKFAGVVGIDVSLAGLTASIEAEELVAGGYSFLVDRDGRALALPDRGYVDVLGRARGTDEFGPDMKMAVPTFLPIINNTIEGGTNFQSIMVNDKELFVAYSPLPATGWARVNVFEAEKMLTAVGMLKTNLDSSTRSLIYRQLLPVGAVIVIVVSIIGLVLTNRLVDPIQKLAEGTKRIGAGDWDAPLPKGGHDEIGTLSTAIREMATQIRESIQDLERHVADRTRALATVTEVGTATSTILETDKLLQAVVDLTKERFDLYHSHIYLLDATGKNLVLASGAGEPGRQMVAEGRSIPIDREQSLVARAARERKGVIVNDVMQAPDFLPNPLLPDTRSELAVPMIVGGNLIGVFDIQSDIVGRFTDADVSVQTALAAQLATSIQNVRTFEKARTQAQLDALVNTIGQKIQRAATVEDTLQTAVREIGLALGVSRVRASIGVTRRDGGTGASNN